MGTFIDLAYQGKDIVFRFIIKSIVASLRDFGPSVIIIMIGLFLYEGF
jgi:hypothetical protein